MAVVLSPMALHAATGCALVAGLSHPKGHQRYPSHVVVPHQSFVPVGAGRPLSEERVMQLDQARTVPAPPRSARMGAVAAAVRNGHGCPDGYGLSTAFRVHFQIDGYLALNARHGAPMRPVEVPGGKWPRGSVWLAGGDARRTMVIVSNETYNEISDFVQGLEVGERPVAGSAEVLVQAAERGGPARAGYVLPALRSLAKKDLRGAGRLATADLDALDRCLLTMIGE